MKYFIDTVYRQVGEQGDEVRLSPEFVKAVGLPKDEYLHLVCSPDENKILLLRMPLEDMPPDPDEEGEKWCFLPMDTGEILLTGNSRISEFEQDVFDGYADAEQEEICLEMCYSETESE